MMKRILTMMLAAFMAVGMTACGGEELPTQEVDYSMMFENQTGRDISKLEIRPSENADWVEITLTEGTWKNSYEMPVTLQGQLPIAENGWQVQMTFADDETDIWEGVNFADETTITFSFDEGDETAVVPSVAAEEKAYDETEDFTSGDFEKETELQEDLPAGAEE